MALPLFSKIIPEITEAQAYRICGIFINVHILYVNVLLTIRKQIRLLK
jgi:hypothetical protein